MKIRYKLIEHERTEDAPFIGCLICAIQCHIGCKNCFNSDIKKMPDLEVEVSELLDQVQANPFNEGIILGGLEWSEQPFELIHLVQEAVNRHLKVMIYTGLTYESFSKNIPIKKLMNLGIYLKYGAFDETLKVTQYKQYDVVLASSNQRICCI